MAQPDSLTAEARPIAFTLHNTNVEGPPFTLKLFVRPEDLSISFPSRLSVTQTFGKDGAWADSFGPGVNTITLSGTTGWRGSRDSLGGGDDGYEHFVKLHKMVFSQWHALRDACVKAGSDPDKVLLIFSDGLDNLNWVVAPQNFTLKRNKSRPLLAQYSITMHRLSGDARIKSNPPPNPLAQKGLAISSLLNGLSSLQAFAAKLSSMASSVLGPIKESIGKFVALTASIAKTVISAVRSIVGVVHGVVGDLVGMAQNIMRAGMNIAQTIAAVTSLPMQIRAEFQRLGGAYTNMMCVLKNIFKTRTLLPNYDIFGSGNCASTAGGHGISNYVSENTFAAIITIAKSSVSLSTVGAGAVIGGANLDPTTSSLAAAAKIAQDIAGGVVVS